MPDAQLLVEEFRKTLDHLAHELADEPLEQLTRLFVLGLEREAIVTVSYRRDVIESRLSRMPIDDDVREVVAQAIRWAWRDEEMHALYVRGALLEGGELYGTLRAFWALAQGKLGGWTSSRQQHFQWDEAPLVRTAAEVLEILAALSGQIPDAARDELHFATFTEFCAFSIAAETTAAIGWARMAALAGESGIALGDRDAFLRMEEDEKRHARMFEVFRDAFGPDDRLKDGVDAAVLIERLGTVGQRFLALPRPDDVAWRNPLGKGAEVVVGRRDGTVGALVDRVLTDAGVPDRIAKLDEGATVAIKTSFMFVTDRRDLRPCPSPSLLRAVAAWFCDRGLSVAILDAPNGYDRHYDARGVAAVAGYLGLVDERWTIVDTGDDQVDQEFVRGLGVRTVSRTWRDAAYRVVVGKLRPHPTGPQLSLAALEGLTGRCDDQLLVNRKVDSRTATLMAIDATPPQLALLDALAGVPSGRTDGRVVAPGRLYASTDALALDRVAARHAGYRLSDDRVMLSAAVDWFGDPGDRIVVGEDRPIEGLGEEGATRFLAQLAPEAGPALFAADVDVDAFPEKRDLPAPLRLVRNAARNLSRPAPLQTPLLETRFLKLPSGRVRIARAGEGEPIVLLHGYPETLQLWARLFPKLAEVYDVIAFDWPGMGYSERFSGMPTPWSMADQIAAILDALDVERAVVVGADMGGPPALCLAARAPARVRAVAVMNSMLFGDRGVDGPMTSWEIELMRRASLQRLAFAATPRVVYRRCLQTFLPDGERLSAAVDADFRAAFQQRSVRRHITWMCDGYEHAFADLPRTYERVTRPVLALWAEHDHHFPPAQGARLAASSPTARLSVVPRAWHWMAWSRPDEVAAALGAFLSETGSAA